MMKKEIDVDGLQQRLGNGKFQILSFIVLGLIYSRGAWHVFGIMFLAGDPGHQCFLPESSDEIKHIIFERYGKSDVKKYLASNLSDNEIYERQDNSRIEIRPKSFNHSLKDFDHNDDKISYDLDLTTNLLHSFKSGSGDIDIIGKDIFFTAESCSVSFQTVNGSKVQRIEDCPYGWSYGSHYDQTVLSEVS